MMESLDKELVFYLNSVLLNNLVYADDVVLLSESKAALNNLLRTFQDHLAAGGLIISGEETGKSASLCISCDGKDKRWTVDGKA